MLWLWLTLPFMVLAVLISLIVLFRSIHEESRARAGAIISGEVPVPDDGAARIVVAAKPGAVDDLGDALARTITAAPDGEVWEQADTVRTPEGDQVLVTVPADVLRRRGDAADRIEEHLADEDAFGEVDRLDAD
jgi:hypothetical protein